MVELMFQHFGIIKDKINTCIETAAVELTPKLQVIYNTEKMKIPDKTKT